MIDDDQICHQPLTGGADNHARLRPMLHEPLAQIVAQLRVEPHERNSRRQVCGAANRHGANHGMPETARVGLQHTFHSKPLANTASTRGATRQLENSLVDPSGAVAVAVMKPAMGWVVMVAEKFSLLLAKDRITEPR